MSRGYGGPEMAPKPPTFGAPRQSRDAPLCRGVMGAPRWPPNPQRSERPGKAVTLLYVAGLWGPRDGPQTPNVRSAPAKAVTLLYVAGSHDREASQVYGGAAERCWSRGSAVRYEHLDERP